LDIIVYRVTIHSDQNILWTRLIVDFHTILKVS